MKPVLLQNLMKRHRKEKMTVDPTVEETRRKIDNFFLVIFGAVALLVVGGIAIGA